MEERERVRERKNVREKDSGGDGGSTETVEGESHARPGENVRKGGFDVESKTFEVEVEERRGRLQATIVERKGGISSWVRLGPVSLGIVLDCLILSIEDERMGRWRGCFLRLGVADLERKRFSIFIPKGRGAKGGWASMVETLRSLGCEDGRIKSQKEDEPRSKPNMAKTYAEATNMARGKEENRSKGRGHKGGSGKRGRPQRVGNPVSENLEPKGNLGLAKMERGKVLMEFEFLIEVEQVSKLGSSRLICFLVGAGYFEEDWGGVWGFLAVDYQTEKMEELQWARLLVKRNGETPPNAVEVWVEESCYSVTLWWEVRPVMKVSTTGKKGKVVAAGEEVGGDVSARASERVTVAMEGSRLEDTLLIADGTRGQSNGSGQTPNPSRSDDGSLGGPHVSGGLGLLGQAKPSQWSKASDSPGLILFGLVDSGIGKPTEKAKPMGCFKGLGWTTKAHLLLVCLGPRRKGPSCYEV
ncbi:hypothetical protein CK203_100736 [Vitis vinifera]|uniref:DUF4283 domain-containing protein n=1 Tax=Vitis vinifera TaxID=29760 RepID=A0A438DES3_VITVI|nr:hypothetical protein CK203_100736 [Vitis vinifera]